MEDSGKTFESEEEETNYWRDLAMTYKQRSVLQLPSLFSRGVWWAPRMQPYREMRKQGLFSLKRPLSNWEVRQPA
jgi:hypothetical protein